MNGDRLYRLVSQLDCHRDRLADHEAALTQTRETIHVAAVDGSLTDGQRVASLVGQGLTIKNGTLSQSGGN